MSQPSAFDLANDEEFRLLFGAAQPPVPAEIITVNATDYTCLAITGEDSEVTAVALNGWHYAVGDRVYLSFAANSPDNALIIGRPVGSHQLGIGLTDPQGPLHVQGVNGHFMIIDELATTSGPYVFTAGFATVAVTGRLLVSDGTSWNTATLSLAVPAASYNAQPVSVGGNTVAFRLYYTGSMRAWLTAGTTNIKIIGDLLII